MFPFNMFRFGSTQPFKVIYQCFPVVMMPGSDREDVEKGGKIIMPPSALQQLTDANMSYPMMFKLRNPKLDRCTHCGVLEFVADEGRVYLPMWMMGNLMLNEGDLVEVQHTVLPVATFSRFQPQSADFLDISNPKAVLENCLRYYACLTAGDVINLKYNDKDYQLSVLETRPSNAVSIIECDMNVDFAPPIGYVESAGERASVPEKHDDPLEHLRGFVAFGGSGNRLDGKAKRHPHNSAESTYPSSSERGIPDYDWKLGTITFMRNIRSDSQPSSCHEDPGSNEQATNKFPGQGNILSS